MCPPPNYRSNGHVCESTDEGYEQQAVNVDEGENKYCHITPIWHRLFWIPVPDILYLRDAVMTYMCINNLALEYLSTNLESCRIQKKAYNTRSKVDDCQNV